MPFSNNTTTPKQAVAFLPYFRESNESGLSPRKNPNLWGKSQHVRRFSLDGSGSRSKTYLIQDIDSTLKTLLNNEDTDNDHQITIDDTGPKVLHLGTVNSDGFKTSAVRGTYMLSNLLQELTIAKNAGLYSMRLSELRLNENPVQRMKRLISLVFWKNLTRAITEDNVFEMAKDTKIVEETMDKNGHLIKSKESVRIYIPHGRKDQYEYYLSIKNKNPLLKLDVQLLPEVIDADYIYSINKKPGLLALESRPDPGNPKNLIQVPYIVPGGRFNEFYGWDSYMTVLGLLVDVTSDNQDNLKIARGMTENFIYEITNYNKILNANRSYYLGRSQPPFLTDMALQVYKKTIEVNPDSGEDMLDFLRLSTLAAIKEYHTVWCAKPRLDEETGLSCYHPEGRGIPPETESSHFDSILKKYVDKYQMTKEEFIEAYNENHISEPDLDEYFLHDRAVRESGHDTTYRLEGKAAYLATVDLNSLLYKYEVDIAYIIEKFFCGCLINPQTQHPELPSEWAERASLRKARITKYLWNEEDSIFYDYHIREKRQHKFESATCLWPLWAKAATSEQADKLVANSLSKLEEYGGLAGSSARSVGEVGLDGPSRQWDYPFGWAPHQILAWAGLKNYNHAGTVRRLAYRWLFMMTRAFVDYNGVVVEKYNVLKGVAPHKVDAEYGNQGLDFKGVALEGFGWVNASYVVGLTYLSEHAQRSIGALIPPDVFLNYLDANQKRSYLVRP
ncbi:trehalase-domain-containing protein [Metschnikowia bicuspidata var. bicuspidata NRRL YB-4993]|uniref:Trehalase n=1 Tax=Metschnikowia bicuspidata var. bicuspidata NRRL YB-4993 TaxID=869754 RepID=A0A1A0H5E7_9ASCO|nr:trehalase-domain-containing protein [Metschnikowia bicuspidata var. bicuspidata NRRL YB-4993]OBA19261.1 trehalase-domain-containing protein [Metschnikowia bicuspidata var. bicuspidata NRRL YB-4993]